MTGEEIRVNEREPAPAGSLPPMQFVGVVSGKADSRKATATMPNLSPGLPTHHHSYYSLIGGPSKALSALYVQELPDRS